MTLPWIMSLFAANAVLVCFSPRIKMQDGRCKFSTGGSCVAYSLDLETKFMNFAACIIALYNFFALHWGTGLLWRRATTKVCTRTFVNCYILYDKAARPDWCEWHLATCLRVPTAEHICGIFLTFWNLTCHQKMPACIKAYQSIQLTTGSPLIDRQSWLGLLSRFQDFLNILRCL